MFVLWEFVGVANTRRRAVRKLSYIWRQVPEILKTQSVLAKTA